MRKAEAVKKLFASYVANRKDIVETLLTEDFTFSSPRDDRIDKATYFERCWPQPPVFRDIIIERLFENGDDVIVGYRAEKITGAAFRNLELIEFRGDRISSVEVYFGRDI
ncbi:nuclear transport factor 2-like protein [Neorhizobium alkalisoli]|uniref:nuclear transport factor 2 family protein n=1 Tax=Neorhizobium alkalisoli TaxID=528178 RepID=UPI000CF9C436|nr:nuclear transport factor 2 family protein [Neorhizobium alkalisoli]